VRLLHVVLWEMARNATSRRSELLKRTLVEQAREKLDDRWWSMKATGTFFPGPKPFVKSRRLLALAREVLKKHGFCAIFAHQDSKGYHITGILKSYEGTFVVYEGICSSLMVIRNDVGDFLVSCFAQRESPRSIVSKTLSKQLGGKTKTLRL
jgi:hypothetical protein